MSILKTAAVAALVAAAFAGETASAAPGAFTPVAAAPVQVTPVVNGYGPLHNGIYGRRRHSRRSYGTGYHGRGTATGGPVGGLPSRN